MFLGQEEVALQVLELNLIEGRNTVVSVVNLNAQQQVYPFIEDVNHISMFRAVGSSPLEVTHQAKRFKDVAHWNPLLLMILKNEQRVVERLVVTRISEFMHLQSCMSKPYTLSR